MTAYDYLRDMATCEIWLPERYGYLRDMRAYKILAITECLILVLTYTARYDSLWLPAGYGCQRDITHSRTSASSDPIYPAILPDSEIWLPVRYGYL